jgi:phosphoglycolate phosphatase
MTDLAGDIRGAGRPAGRSLVLFDWDGVLADSLEAFTTVFLEACRRNGFRGLEAPGRLMSLFDDNLYASLAAIGMRPEGVRRILSDFRENTLARLDEIRLFDGIAAALDAIAERHVVMIVTANLSDIVRRVLRREGVRCVTEILGVEAGTSKVEKIRQAGSRYPSLPAFYVGDTSGDMREGRIASARTVAVLWGWHPEEKLREAAPDLLIRSPEELAAFFGAGVRASARSPYPGG